MAQGYTPLSVCTSGARLNHCSSTNSRGYSGCGASRRAGYTCAPGTWCPTFLSILFCCDGLTEQEGATGRAVATTRGIGNGKQVPAPQQEQQQGAADGGEEPGTGRRTRRKVDPSSLQQQPSNKLHPLQQHVVAEEEEEGEQPPAAASVEGMLVITAQASAAVMHCPSLQQGRVGQDRVIAHDIPAVTVPMLRCVRISLPNLHMHNTPVVSRPPHNP
jgi:hypothetical protein